MRKICYTLIMRLTKKEIFILVNAAKCSGRGILHGFLSTIGARDDLRLHICEMSTYGQKSLANAILSNQVDGLVTSEIENTLLSDLLENSAFPLVVIGTREHCLPRRKGNMRVVTTDEHKLAATATKHLISFGRFAAYGYVHFREDFCRYLSKQREQGFFDTLKQAHLKGVSYTTDLPEEKSDIEQLGTWLMSLPKPAAILAGYDRRAADVLDACARNNIAVPDEMRIIGIDNDEIICQQTNPRLTSVTTDNVCEGRVAAQQLLALLRSSKKSHSRKTILSPASMNIVERESTRVLAPGLRLAQRAREFITANANRAVTVEEVVSHLGVSRRLAYLRFREFEHMSIHEAILHARIANVKRRLLNSRQKIITISKEYGFENPNNLKIIFRRLTGMTMREWGFLDERSIAISCCAAIRPSQTLSVVTLLSRGLVCRQTTSSLSMPMMRISPGTAMLFRAQASKTSAARLS